MIEQDDLLPELLDSFLLEASLSLMDEGVIKCLNEDDSPERQDAVNARAKLMFTALAEFAVAEFRRKEQSNAATKPDEQEVKDE